MRERGPRKRDEDGDEAGDVDGEDHHGDVSPPLPSCNGSSFPFEVILSDRVFKDLRIIDVCLA